jgi:hypothetical protein
MATRLLDNGEAYLSADDKRFVRLSDTPMHISSDTGAAMPPLLVTLLLALAVIGLATVAFMI